MADDRYIRLLMTTPLEQLLIVQEHDIALDQLRHRRATLGERDILVRAEAAIRALEPPITETRARRDLVNRDVRRLEDEASAAATKVGEVDKAMYSGSVTSPKELQAMQADLEQLQRHQRALEDRELEFMEQLEAIDGELRELESGVGAAETEIKGARASLAEHESSIDADIAIESAARGNSAAPLTTELLALYEQCRTRTRGIGAARLVGHTCQGCRLTIPATEVDRIRHAAPDAPVSHCDNCGAILVAGR